MNIDEKLRELYTTFGDLFGGKPVVYRAPGCANLIGEYTEYNDGFVMPVAIDRYVWTAISKRNDRTMRIHSTDHPESIEFDLDWLGPIQEDTWINPVQDIIVRLQDSGCDVYGADILISDDIAKCSESGSSSALEVSVGVALLDRLGASIHAMDLFEIGQRSQGEFEGFRGRLKDQFAACYGKKGRAIFLDCRTLEHRTFEIPENLEIVICNTMVKKAVSSEKFDSRRADCEEGCSILARTDPFIIALRDVSEDELDKRRNELPEKVFWHCRHIVTENERVKSAANALDAGDISAFGTFMYESHRSLRDDFEVSSPELNLMVQIASMQSGVIGSRMTNGTFAGCTINLVNKESTDEFIDTVSREYQLRTSIEPEIYVCSVVGGVERVLDDCFAII